MLLFLLPLPLLLLLPLLLREWEHLVAHCQLYLPASHSAHCFDSITAVRVDSLQFAFSCRLFLLMQQRLFTCKLLSPGYLPALLCVVYCGFHHPFCLFISPGQGNRKQQQQSSSSGNIFTRRLFYVVSNKLPARNSLRTTHLSPTNDPHAEH